jgi:putative ABC transport system substrate-binding protein
VRRRALLAAGAAALAPSVAATQGPRGPRIGVLLHGRETGFVDRLLALRTGLAERGYVEPRTLELIFRFSDGDVERLPVLARELVAAEPDLIVSSTAIPIRAAMAATTTIPIVFASTADAVRQGLAASLAHPGGNATGSTVLQPELTAKQLELLTELVPGLTRVGALFGRAESATSVEALVAAAAARGIAVQAEPIASSDQAEPAVEALRQAGCQAAIVIGGATILREWPAVAAAARRLPAIAIQREFADSGGLVSYGPDTITMWRRAAYFIDRILKGTKPADLPVEQPAVFQLVINLRAAKALGVTVPHTLVGRADEVIE